MKRIVIFSIFLASILTGCSVADNVAADPYCTSFVPGDLSLGIDKKSSFKDAVALIDANDVPIQRVYTLVYRSAFPIDSIDYIVGELNAKSYIDSHGNLPNPGTVYEKDDSLTVLVSFNNFDKDAQADWFKTATALNLVEQANLKSFLLAVPAGEEKDWIRKFLAQQNVAYAQLNCYSQINPYYK